MSVEERCRAAWEREAAIRGEFGGQFSAFIGWERALAAGLIKDPEARSLLIDAPAAVTGKSFAALPALGAAFHGGRYGGLSAHANLSTALVLLPGVERKNWKDAKTWAGEQSGVLPSRVDLLVLVENLKDEFKHNAYWSDDVYVGDDAEAWTHWRDGSHEYYHKSYVFPVRAIRRALVG